MVHSPKGTPSRIPLMGIALRLIVGTQFQILFHSAHRRSFHLSLTVLVHYRSPNVFSLGWWSTRIPTRFLVPRGTQDTRQRQSSFAYGTVTLCGLPFRIVLLDNCFVTPYDRSYNPIALRRWFGLLHFRSPLLAEYSLFLRVLRCFSSPGSLPYPMCSDIDD